eukprot:scaffold248413_cov39-Cyclotella_meneghiniana.AAC.1
MSQSARSWSQSIPAQRPIRPRSDVSRRPDRSSKSSLFAGNLKIHFPASSLKLIQVLGSILLSISPSSPLAWSH